MPYKSKAQEAYFNANRAKLEKQGVDVDEWNQASKGKKLPERKAPMAKKKEKEIGIPKNAPKAVKKADEAKDKAMGIKEGSAKDIREDKKLLKESKGKGYDKKKYVRD